ncbi:tensin 3-2 isoform X2 [Scleropages formosus]|uniref:tensin 3-2 isoform X2 n=1 Tax=Scleropages formosus TaxID=113540 RepID=UPI0010FA68EA|nr:tensin-3 isoform X2 [Scleropages formosus]
MEEGYELDLTYVTERIIAVSFPRACSEDTYLHNLQDVTRMLRSKHGDSYLVINLSEKRYDLSKMNPKTMDTGWPDLHAPPLDKICTICKAMESWLNADPQHVVVIHCRGGKGRIGVIISSYVHFTNISASADQALDRFAMKKFYDDKVSALMTPSQKRYVWILNSLLTGSMKMNSSLLFLHYILLHGIPKLDASGVCRLYLKVYQGMQAVYTSGIYHINPGHKGRICIALEPAQLLKGDIMVKCYHKSIDPPGREVVFRVQFHTGMVHGCRLTFDKEDLEHANSDSRFPHYGKIELVFSEIPEKMQGCDHWQNGPGVVVDYDIGDPLVRWDSYEKLSADGEVLHTQGPVDNSLYAKVRKKSADSAPTGTVTNSPEHSDHALSASSDSGLSSTSVRTGRGPSRQERAALQRLLSGFGLEAPALPKEMEEQRGPGPGAGGGHHVVPAQMHTNGEGERETDILDDEAPAHDLHSVDSIGTLSSSEGLHCQPLGRCGCHQSSQNSLLSDGFGGLAPATADLGFGSDDNERDRGPGYTTQVALTTPQAFGQGGYFTQTWVRQQQMVAAQQYVYPPADGEVQFQREKPGLASPKTSPVAPNTPIRGSSSREATLRAGGGGLGDPNVQETSLSKDDELASLTVDIDQSIDQLNQLIMDLDPTFVPIPTQTSLVRREGRGHVNGTASPCANGRGRRLTDGMEGTLPISYQTGGPACDRPGDGARGLTPLLNDVVDHLELRSMGWGLSDRFRNTTEMLPSERTGLYAADAVEYSGRRDQLGSRMESGSEMIPPTPAFPISPPTPYVKTLSEFSQVRVQRQLGGPYEPYRTVHEPRGYMEGLNHGTVSPDEDPFRSDAPVSAAACQGPFGSMRSLSTSSPLPRMESPSSVQSWQDGSTRATLSQQSALGHLTPPYPGPLDLSGLSHSAPNCHSSPRGTPRGQSCRALGPEELTQDLEQSLLAAMEGLGRGGTPVQPSLPEKRRVSEGEGEHSLGTGSPALSGFSSPHSGSTISIPFPSVLPDLSNRGQSSTSPLPDALTSKHVTVKFVQDTSKFWYKPDISRDQAISVLKDKEPGSFIVRDSHSFRGAYGLAMKVATPPPSVLQQSKKGSLPALVCQHSITPLALPCKLIIPDRDPLEDMGESLTQTATNSATELLKQGAACNVWYLGSVEMESLTGYQAVQKAASMTLSMDPPPTSTVVHFKVSAQGITLTDNQRKLFFRRHYAVSTVIFCALDPQDRKWTRDGCTLAKIFGFVARKTGSSTENVCHVFAEHDPEQPASAIVNFVSKVMIGSLKNK